MRRLPWCGEGTTSTAPTHVGFLGARGGGGVGWGGRKEGRKEGRGSGGSKRRVWVGAAHAPPSVIKGPRLPRWRRGALSRRRAGVAAARGRRPPPRRPPLPPRVPPQPQPTPRLRGGARHRRPRTQLCPHRRFPRPPTPPPRQTARATGSSRRASPAPARATREPRPPPPRRRRPLARSFLRRRRAAPWRAPRARAARPQTGRSRRSLRAVGAAVRRGGWCVWCVGGRGWPYAPERREEG